MPALSIFYGIIIRMYSEARSPHKMPYLHAVYQQQESVYDFDGNKIEGGLPKNKEKLVEAWISLHREDLEANWSLLKEGAEHFKIPPLQ